ncbi:hypothetical protein THII_3171 [Thioploca ingrica]|uniref:Uncharacterized protein n=1 Tax=Thioploca ingrica TaxID=40754 RepID=A0A090AGS4_9GAMM|nr:hypothetical protein THII_3171 [Thioploca ingrica]
MLPFTYREIERAWRQNLKVSIVKTRENPHRLLLFYAVECGLKAVIMKREGLSRTDRNSNISQLGHDINGLLEYLKVRRLRLTGGVKMKTILTGKKHNENRPVEPKELNQMWRYGGEAEGIPSNANIENQLLNLVKWIEKELQR